MAAVSPALIRELREISGAGMTDCKKALEAADGDVQKAVVVLREKGLAQAAKKAGRIAAEGLVLAVISADGKRGAIVEVNCETDFVAKNPGFRAFADNVAGKVLDSSANTVEALLSESWITSDFGTVEEAVKSTVALYGENINVRRFARFVKQTPGFLQKYIHGEGRIAVIIDIESDKTTDALLEAAKNLCMQVTVMRPIYVSKDNIEQSFIEQEKEIMRQQSLNDEKSKGKPANVIEKMVEGRLAKRLKEVCLLDQEFIRDANITAGKYFEDAIKAEGATAKPLRFEVYEKGEGIAKKEENFADEVNKMIG